MGKRFGGADSRKQQGSSPADSYSQDVERRGELFFCDKAVRIFPLMFLSSGLI